VVESLRVADASVVSDARVGTTTQVTVDADPRSRAIVREGVA
jgi:hypothetical protein